MRITFYSCYMNHHQLPLALELYNCEGIDYHFVAKYPFNEQRKQLGYVDMNSQFPFIVRMYESAEEEAKAIHLAKVSDVIIHDTSFAEMENFALQNGRLVFRYSEHLLKKGIWQIIRPGSILKIISSHFMLSKANDKKSVYLLCASAYRGVEAKLFHEYPRRMFKWGYFTEFYQYALDGLMAGKIQERIELLWCGRFLAWKNVEWTIDIAKYLKTRNICFRIRLIGEGEEKGKLKELIEKENLSHEIEMHSGVNYKEMRKYMEAANIYLFLSNHEEGWGAVLNEAMNSGCAVVANFSAGSVPYLVRHGYNGMVFRNGDVSQLKRRVYELCVDKKKREDLGINAYYTIMNEWSPAIAASNLITLCKALQVKNKSPIKNGPGSKA